MKFLFLSLFITFSLTQKSEASFEENTHRYLTSFEVFDSLAQMLPDIGNGVCGKNKTITQVQAVNVLAALGENATLNGSPISQGPSQGTISWISACISAVLNSAQITYYEKEDFEIVFADPLIMEKLREFHALSSSKTAKFNGIFLLPWNSFPDALKKDLIRYFVYSYLGSDAVILDFGMIQDPEKFREKLKQILNEHGDQSAIDVIQKLTINLALRDEFLSY